MEGWLSLSLGDQQSEKMMQKGGKDKDKLVKDVTAFQLLCDDHLVSADRTHVVMILEILLRHIFESEREIKTSLGG